MLHTNQATQKGLVGEFLTQNKKDIPLPNQNETLWGVGGGGGDVFFPKKKFNCQISKPPKIHFKKDQIVLQNPPPQERACMLAIRLARLFGKSRCGVGNGEVDMVDG